MEGQATNTCNTNLLLFFSGHGAYNEQAKVGYWAARNSVPNNFSTHLSYAEVRGIMSGYSAGHVMIVNDVCYGGGIFREHVQLNCFPVDRVDIATTFARRSRTAMTSGVLEVVPAQSFFFRTLMDELSQTRANTLRAFDLHKAIEVRMDDAPAGTPQPKYDCLGDLGQLPGGDFVFQRKP